MEVYHNGEWGTVCDDGWDLNDAQVVCNELGFGNATVARHNAFYGKGHGNIWLDNLNCVGTESTIGNCLHRGWELRNCKHHEDAGVKCATGIIGNYYSISKYNSRDQHEKTSVPLFCASTTHLTIHLTRKNRPKCIGYAMITMFLH